MKTGKDRRLRRLLNEDGRTLLVAVDHAMTTGAAGGLHGMRSTLSSVVRGGADGIVMHRGSALRTMPVQRGTALVVHLSGNTALSDSPELKTRVCDPEEALALGAEAVSCHITLGCGLREDRDALRDLGELVGAAFALFFALVLHFQLGLGYSALRSSFALFPMALALVVASPAAPWLTRRLGLRWVTAVGLALLASVLLVMGHGDVASEYGSLVLPMVLVGAGLGLSAPPATLAIVDDVPPSAQGVASAVNDLARKLGGAIGIALAGSLLAAELSQRSAGRRGGSPSGTDSVDVLRSDYVAAYEHVASTLGLIVLAALVLLCVLAPANRAAPSHPHSSDMDGRSDRRTTP